MKDSCRRQFRHVFSIVITCSEHGGWLIQPWWSCEHCTLLSTHTNTPKSPWAILCRLCVSMLDKTRQNTNLLTGTTRQISISLIKFPLPCVRRVSSCCASIGNTFWPQGKLEWNTKSLLCNSCSWFLHTSRWMDAYIGWKLSKIIAL